MLWGRPVSEPRPPRGLSVAGRTPPRPALDHAALCYRGNVSRFHFDIMDNL